MLKIFSGVLPGGKYHENFAGVFSSEIETVPNEGKEWNLHDFIDWSNTNTPI